MDGYALMALLQEDRNLEQVPVIAITANAMEQDIERGHLAGFSDYLTKPLNVKTLLKAVNTCLEQTRKNRA
jgi:CheY-like chemotaxis protein